MSESSLQQQPKPFPPPTMFGVYFNETRVHANPDCPINIHRTLMAASRAVASDTKLRPPSESLRCETCDSLRKKYNWELPSHWCRPSDCQPDPECLPVSSELVMLYCSISALRKMYHELREEVSVMGAMVESAGEGGSVDLDGLKDQVGVMAHIMGSLKSLAF
ncbi:hypothetical protein AB1N83_010435 [Pleurotus pulmonarius]